MLNLFFSFLLLLSCLPAFSQEDIEKSSLSPGGGKVIIKPSSGSASSGAQADSSESPTEGSSIPDEDSSVAELEKARAKQLEKMKLIEKSIEPLKSPMLNPIDEIKKLGHKQLDFNALLDKRVLTILRDAFKDGVLGHLPEAEVRKIILEKIQGSLLGSLVETFPKLLNLLVDLARDKHVFHGLLTMLERREDLKLYGYIWIGILIFGLLLKRRLVKPKWDFFKRFKWNMTINFFLSLFSLSVFYFMFSIELDPLLSVIAKQF